MVVGATKAYMYIYRKWKVIEPHFKDIKRRQYQHTGADWSGCVIESRKLA